MLVRLSALICFGEILKLCFSFSRNSNESAPRIKVPPEVRPEECRCSTGSSIGTDRSRGSLWPCATEAESWVTSSLSEKWRNSFTTLLSSKASSTLWVAHPRFHPPAPELLPATIQRTPHLELAQRPRKSCLSLIPVSVPPSFAVTSSLVVLPDSRKSRLIFSMAPELPFVRVGARSGTTRQPWQNKETAAIPIPM